MSVPRIVLAICLTLAFGARSTSAQDDESELRIFGYFQTLFQYQGAVGDISALSSFSLQQLNLLLQKRLADRWSAFVNIEAVNSFSSRKNFGSLKFEEAWLKYRASGKFSVKIGLQIPTFNNLNEIKNRSPLLPYVIRPYVYETSFEGDVEVEEWLPTRGFIQMYGFLPSGRAKFDYALFVGNTPHINGDNELGQTGIDTKSSFLAGGRLGIRYRTLKLGFSMSHERADFEGSFLTFYGGSKDFENIPRVRLGTDLSLDVKRLTLEGEWIYIHYGERDADIDIDKFFYYGTLGYHINESLFVYGGYWYSREEFTIIDFKVKVPTFGASYHLHDRITFKAQYARPKRREELKVDFNEIRAEVQALQRDFYSAAVSVFF